MQWDILSNGGMVQEMAHIANGREPGNCVSLLRVNVIFLLLVRVISVFAFSILVIQSCSFRFFVTERELEPEQHADTTRELH